MTASTTGSEDAAAATVTTGGKIKAILFDMDGTLLDTETLSDRAVLLATFGGTVPPHILSRSPMSDMGIPWELKKRLLGLSGAEWAPIVVEYARKHWQPADAGPSHDSTVVEFPDAMRLWKAWEDHLGDMCGEVEACAGAKELVRALAESNRPLPMAIATSSRYAGVRKKRRRHERGMFEHIRAVVAGDDPAVKRGKPAPDVYLEAARRLQVRPEECLVFEDALSGVKAGKAAGCRVVAVPDPRYTPEERSVFATEGGADVILNSLWEFDGRPFGLDVNMPSLQKDQL